MVKNELYYLSIPRCCSLKNYADHEKIGFCGKLLTMITTNNILDCTGCKYIIKENLFLRVFKKIKNFLKLSDSILSDKEDENLFIRMVIKNEFRR